MAQGLDHDPPAQQKFVPLGILMVVTGALSLFFAAGENSDLWVDALLAWWARVGPTVPTITKLVIYLDNGPNNSGRRTQFLKRMVQFADATGLTVRLVYYPPYHSKYNPVERCWSALQRKWNGALLNCWEVIRDHARRMTWRKMHPTVERLDGDYSASVRVSKRDMKPYEARLERSATLPKYDITIRPMKQRQVS